jgi:hypothetical protein
MRGHGRRTTASRRAIAPGMAITRAPWLSAPAAQHADSHRGEWRATPDNSRCGETHARSSIALRPHAPHGVSDPEAESRAYPERLATRTVSSPGPVMCRTSSRSEGPRSVEQPAAPYATLRLRSLYARRRPPPRPSDTLRERRFGRRGHVAHAFGGTRRCGHWWCRPVAVQARPVQGRCSATRASRWRTPSTQEVADTPVASQPADCMRSASSSESPRSCAMSRSRGVRGRQRPTLPRSLDRSTIGAVRLNDRVRDGNGCGPDALVASDFSMWWLTDWWGNDHDQRGARRRHCEV